MITVTPGRVQGVLDSSPPAFLITVEQNRDYRKFRVFVEVNGIIGNPQGD
jgi:hypothetical protein